jgi:hypothetical protein
MFQEPDALQAEADRRFPLSGSHKDAFIKGAQWLLTRQQVASSPGCTCWNSSFGMDVDRCTVHGEGCA